MPSRDVLLIHGPIHYDLLIPLDDISRPRFASLEARGVPLSHPDARWLVIGWGARKFYTQTPTYRELKPGNVWRGVIGDDAVLRIDVIGPINQQINVWIGDQLRAAGLRFGRWTPLPLSVSLSYQLYQSERR